MPPSPPAAPQFILALLVCLGAILGALVLLPWAALQLHKRVRFAAQDVLVVVGVMVVAFALRWWLPDHALIHENRHGYRYAPTAFLDMLSVLDRFAAHSVFSSQLLLQSIVASFVPPADAVFVLGAVLSALTTGAMYVFGWQLTGSRTAAWAGAVALVTLPVAIMMGPTEEFLVLTCCAVLWGTVLVRAGVVRGVRAATVAGVLLVVIGAQSREVTIPLSLVVPIVAFASARDAMGRRDALFATLGTGVLLLPQFGMILQAMSGLHEQPPYAGLPIMPWDFRWPGWNAPHVPRWVAWTMLVGAVAMPAVLWRRGRRKEAAAFLAMLLVAQLAGGFVTSGNWPSQLRHELFALTLFTLAAGWLVAEVARRMPAGGVWVMPVLGAAPLLLQPASYRPQCAHIQEYLFAREAIESLPEGASLVRLDSAVLTPNAPHLRFVPFSYDDLLRPDLRGRSIDGLAPADLRSEEVFFLVDRACFVGAEPRPGGLSARVANVDDLGVMNDVCRQKLAPGRWDVVRSLEVETPPPPHDLQMAQPAVRIALLKLTALEPGLEAAGGALGR